MRKGCEKLSVTKRGLFPCLTVKTHKRVRVPAPGYFVWCLKVTLLKASKAVVAVSDRGKLSISGTSEEEKRKNNNLKKRFRINSRAV